MVLADPRLRLHQRRRHDQVPGGGGQAQVVGGAQARDDERTCPNGRWRGVRRAVGGGDGTLVGNGRAGGGSGDAVESWAHMSRECATNPAKSKGKLKDNGGYGGFKGKGKGIAIGGGDKGFGGGGKGGDIKGKGKGYLWTCWTCGAVGHASSECLHHRATNAVEDDVGGAVSTSKSTSGECG